MLSYVAPFARGGAGVAFPCAGAVMSRRGAGCFFGGGRVRLPPLPFPAFFAVGQAGAAHHWSVSMTMVTGPSLAMFTSISAPNSPCLTSLRPCFSISATNSSYASMDSGGFAAVM